MGSALHIYTVLKMLKKLKILGGRRGLMDRALQFWVEIELESSQVVDKCGSHFVNFL